MDYLRVSLSVWGLGLGLGLGAGCQNNSIELETMTDADDDAGTGGSDSTTTATTVGSATSPGTTSPGTATSPGTTTTTTTSPPDAEGGVTSVGPTDTDGPASNMMLMAIDTDLAPGLPLQAIVWAEPSDDLETVDLQMQWLSLDVGSTTEPRELVGDVYAYPGIPLGPDLGFTWDMGVVLVPGAANPITGSDLVFSGTAQVTAVGSPFCGEVAGELISPISAPFQGTHAITFVDNELELPLDFPWSC